MASNHCQPQVVGSKLLTNHLSQFASGLAQFILDLAQFREGLSRFADRLSRFNRYSVFLENIMQLLICSRVKQICFGHSERWQLG